MKSKKILLMGGLVITLVLITSVQFAASYIIIDPPPSVVYLAWYRKPSDKTVESGTSLSVTWKAKSSFSGRGYTIKKNGVAVQSGSWSSYSPITYTYTANQIGTDELKCTVYDSRSTLYDYCYITVLPAPDTDGDGVTDSRELVIGTDPNNPNDPLGQHFEDQSVGENPNGWEVTEFAGYSDIRIADSSTLGLTNQKPGNLVKMTQSQYGAAPQMYTINSKSLSSPLLISYEAGFYSQYDDSGDSGFLEVIANGYTLIKVEYEHDRVCIWESSMHYRNVDLNFKEKHMYRYSLILQNDPAGHVDYSLYIEGACFAFGTVNYATEIQAILFGVTSYTPSEFYVDNIFYDTVDFTNYIYDIPIPIAIPLCWLYAPEVDNVYSAYHVGRSTTAEITIALTVGIPLYKGITLVGGIDIYTWYIEITDEHYGVMVGNGGTDVIVHIRLDYYIDKMSIVLPGTTDVLMDVLINCDYGGSRYYDLSEVEFEAAYGWVPEDPRNNGISNVQSHTETYPDNNNYVEAYVREERLNIISYGGGIELGFGLCIGAEVTYTEEVGAKTYLWINRDAEPQFDFGIPINPYAYLGIQPYIVKPIGTM